MTPSILSNFFQISLHQKIIVIAIPMILSNVTTPLMGMVDTAVLGHMQGTYFLAGASVAALIITQLYWLCGFLRMTSTGLSAQAKGSREKSQLNQSLFQGILIGFLVGLLFVVSTGWHFGLGIILCRCYSRKFQALYLSISRYAFTGRLQQ